MKTYSNKLEKLEEKNKFLETYKLPKLKQEVIENLSKLINTKEIVSVLKNLPTNKVQDDWLYRGILPNI